MAHGRHRKPEDHNKAAAVVTTGALSLAGIAAFGGTANAAPEDAWDRIAECESNQRWDLPTTLRALDRLGEPQQPAVALSGLADHRAACVPEGRGQRSQS